MELRKGELFALANNQKTVNLLFELIATSSDKTEVVYAAIKLAEILFENSHYQETTEVLLKQLNYLSEQKELELYDQALSLIIESFILLKDKNKALHYLNLRRESLPQIEMYKHHLDMLNFKKSFAEDYSAILNVLKAYQFDKTALIPYYIPNFKAQIAAGNDDEITKTYHYLLQLNPNFEEKKEIQNSYFEYLFATEQNDTLQKEIDAEKESLQIFYNLRSLIRTEELKKVQILETESEQKLSELSLLQQKTLFSELVKFYEENRDFRSVEHYEIKLQELEKKILAKEKATKKAIEPKITIPQAKSSLKVLSDTQKESLPSTRKTPGEQLFLLDSFIVEVSALSISLSFFERVRRISILMEKYFDFSDVVFYFNPLVYHYKKSRLYEKKYSQHTINSSILGEAANNFVDIIKKTEDLKFDYDLISNQPLTKTNVKQVYCYAMGNQASVCFYQREEKDLYLDDLTFKVLSNFISYELKIHNFLAKEKAKQDIITELFDSKFLIAFIAKENIIGSPLFNELFKLKKNDSITALVAKFTPQKQVKYNNLIQALKRGERQRFALELNWQNKVYLANHYYNDGYLYGNLIDYTEYKKTHREWQAKAFVNPLYNLFTLHQFEVEFPNYIKGKTTFILMELSNLDKIEFLYGKRLKKEFFKEFAEFSKPFYQQIYQFDNNSLLAVLDVNDIRTVERKIKTFYQALEAFQSKLLAEQVFQVEMGIIRYPINTRETNLEKFYQYLSISLNRAKSGVIQYCYFDFADYQKDLFETEIIRQIDRLIVGEKLRLNFTQIVNQKTNKVYAYEVGVESKSLNIYSEYYYRVAEKRGLLVKLEKYILNQAFKRLNRLYNEANKYVKLSINISSDTLNQPEFNAFLIGLYKTYDIPFEVVEIVARLKEYHQQEYLKLKELASYGITVGSTNISYLKDEFIKVFHYLDKRTELDEKKLSYLEMLNNFSLNHEMKFIVYFVDTKRDKALLQAIKIAYIRGKIVDKTFTFEEILKLVEKAV
ncbi:MAG: EAL domain-containing protein [Acholeplasmataceae bacterium]|nr:EAL domain-containing protein [Acholeplasmataceae bacterium]